MAGRLAGRLGRYVDAPAPAMARLSRRPGAVASAAAAAALAALSPAPASALDIKEQEKAALKVCEKRFCAIILGHDAKAPDDFRCRLSKTWTKRNIKDNVDGKTSPWSLGDARCTADVAVGRGPILEVMTAGRHKIEFEPHKVHCEVENGSDVTVVDVTVGPKIEFKDGKAVKAWIKLKKVDGPGTWKATLWTLAKAEDTLGLFQGQVLAAINKLVHETCPANYPPPGTLEARAKPAAGKRPPESKKQ